MSAKAFLCAVAVAAAFLVPTVSEAGGGPSFNRNRFDNRSRFDDRRFDNRRFDNRRLDNRFFDNRFDNRRLSDFERERLRRELALRQLERERFLRQQALARDDFRFRSTGFGGSTVIRERVGPFGILGSRTTIIRN